MAATQASWTPNNIHPLAGPTTLTCTRFSQPVLKDDGRWYWYYNSGLQAQSDGTLPTFSGKEEPGGEVFFDPNLLSKDGTAALSATAFSRSGEYFAYGISRSVVLSISWTKDSKGFFYQRYPERKSHGAASQDLAGTETDSDTNAMLYYHRVGTSQSEDILVYKDDANPEWFWGTDISEVDGRYLVLSVAKDTSRKNLLWLADLEKESIGQNLTFDKHCQRRNEVLLQDQQGCPQYKLVSIDIASEKREFKEVIPEDKDAHLEDVLAISDDKLIVVYKRNVKDEIYVYSTSGERLTRVAPDFVGAAQVGGRRKQPWFFATLTGFTNPGIVAKYDFTVSDESKRWSTYRTTFLKGLKAEDFEAQQVWYESKDGTKVPMFIVRHKDTAFDGTAPAIQYESLTERTFRLWRLLDIINPFFSAAILTFLQRYGAVLAVPNIRGGGEFGEEWHQGAVRERKVNCFDDFIAATEYLVKNKYAAPGKVAINGGSNGGLLVAACVNRAPEGLLGAAIAEVGVLDLLKFADFTIGRAWVSDYGDPHNPEDFDFIYPISPVHNVPADRTLPPTILLTADPHLASQPHPLLIRIDKKAGHGAGKSTDMRIREAADKWGFVVQSLGLKPLSQGRL
ncbi:hypothetical protein BC629DRAFT_1443455 [Irpex lacteus]|nr:hypothetical protein BC629DRAFT_1443455 [Irpex lacteus]